MRKTDCRRDDLHIEDGSRFKRTRFPTFLIVISMFFTTFRKSIPKKLLSSSPPSSFVRSAFWSCLRTSATEISDSFAFCALSQSLRNYVIVSNWYVNGIIIDRFNDQAHILCLKRSHSSQTLTVIRSGSFENMEDAVRTMLRDRTTPRTMPTGTERLSKHDFLISKFS